MKEDHLHQIHHDMTAASLDKILHSDPKPIIEPDSTPNLASASVSGEQTDRGPLSITQIETRLESSAASIS